MNLVDTTNGLINFYQLNVGADNINKLFSSFLAHFDSRVRAASALALDMRGSHMAYISKVWLAWKWKVNPVTTAVLEIAWYGHGYISKLSGHVIILDIASLNN